MSKEKPWKDEDRLRELYVEEGMSQKEIAEMWGCAQTTVGNWVREFGFETGASVVPEEVKDREWLREQYVEEEKSTRKIANEVGCAYSSIRRYLDEFGIECRENYHGIVERNKKQPLHYRTSRFGYERWDHQALGEYHAIGVHRLLAVAEYGFDAVKDMVVHHKNHIPWDNRPENLELMTASEHAKYHRRVEE